MRRAGAALAALLAVAACEYDPVDEGASAADAPPETGEVIECALAGAKAFARVCAIEFVDEGGQRLMIVRHGDGGFRRFRVLVDGRGVAEADGADVAQVALGEGGIEVSVGPDRYRIPATMQGN